MRDVVLYKLLMAGLWDGTSQSGASESPGKLHTDNLFKRRLPMAVILLRTVLMYGVILLAVRLMGKRQVSQLQNSELVVTLLLSELAVLPIQEEEKPLWVGLAPMAALVACELLVSVLMLKSGRFRQLVCGSPTVVIERGQVLQKAMRRLRLTTEDRRTWPGPLWRQTGCSASSGGRRRSPSPPRSWGCLLPARGWKWWSSATGSCPCAPWGCAARTRPGCAVGCKSGAWSRSRYS